MKNTRLSSELQAAWEEIEQHAKDYGLDFYPIIYEVLDYRTLYETAALGGFPTRYPHWRFGMEYDQLIKGHTYGLSTIYEMVINTNPSYAYLLEGNEIVTQKMVMAHVTGHVDFFKHNMWFAHTNRKMLDEMANHAARIQALIERYGQDKVEDFIDTCLSLENLIDYHSPYIRRAEAQTPQPRAGESAGDETDIVEGLHVDRQYMRDYINPPAFLEQQRKKLEAERAKQRRFPENPQRDILLFLMNFAPLERWQHTVLDIVRNEAYYFAPQGMTKVTNEGWACAASGSRIYTNEGLLTVNNIVDQRKPLSVSDGEEPQRVYEWVQFKDRETIKLRTRRGLEFEGSVTHRLMLPDDSWRRLDELAVGDRVWIGGGQNLWPQELVQLDWQPVKRLSLVDIAVMTGTKPSEVYGYRYGNRETTNDALRQLVATYDEEAAKYGPFRKHRTEIRVPTIVDERLAGFLGYIIGDGHISEVKRTIGLTTGDEEQAESFAGVVSYLFGIEPHWRKDGNRWRISFTSRDVIDFLKHLGLKTGVAAREKTVPDVILRSPKRVVGTFLRALYDCDGYAGKAGIILSTSSDEMSKVVQLLLLNFGILSTRHRQQHDIWNVHTAGKSAIPFYFNVGFGLTRKHEKLAQYIENRQWFKREDWTDEVVSIERGRADVYDISVENTHRYAAQGFINHNSYWHSTIMTQKAMKDSEVINFAELHSGIVATNGRFNPYKVGLELLRDVEDRWNKGKFGKEYDECEDMATKRAWDKQLGLGRQKIFEIRKLYNDVTFIDEFLTPEFCIEQKLFSFKYNRDTDLYEIASREFKEIKEKLLFRLTNFGQPVIHVEDANYNNRGELYLKHRHEGVDLKMDYARETMRNLHKIWTRPIFLETIIDDKRRLLSFDGRDFSERKMD